MAHFQGAAGGTLSLAGGMSAVLKSAGLTNSTRVGASNAGAVLERATRIGLDQTLDHLRANGVGVPRSRQRKKSRWKALSAEPACTERHACGTRELSKFFVE